MVVLRRVTDKIMQVRHHLAPWHFLDTEGIIKQKTYGNYDFHNKPAHPKGLSHQPLTCQDWLSGSPGFIFN